MEKTVGGRYVPYDIVARKDIKDIFSKCNKSKRPVIHTPKNASVEVMHAPIVVDSKIVGHIVIPSIFKSFTALTHRRGKVLNIYSTQCYDIIKGYE